MIYKRLKELLHTSLVWLPTRTHQHRPHFTFYRFYHKQKVASKCTDVESIPTESYRPTTTTTTSFSFLSRPIGTVMQQAANHLYISSTSHRSWLMGLSWWIWEMKHCDDGTVRSHPPLSTWTFYGLPSQILSYWFQPVGKFEETKLCWRN